MAEQTAAIRTRRRGKQLEDALYDAALAELAAVGYGGLTMEGIAARARTGKAALYRRWSSKHDLVQAALLYALPPLPEPRSDRSARENLLAIFTAHCDVVAGKTAFPGLGIMNQLLHEPELRAIFADAVVGPRLRIIESILQARCCSPAPRRTSASSRRSSTPWSPTRRRCTPADASRVG
jgi:AcrR family transcriptional regulator